jgi:hypothetical protein
MERSVAPRRPPERAKLRLARSGRRQLAGHIVGTPFLDADIDPRIVFLVGPRVCHGLRKDQGLDAADAAIPLVGQLTEAWAADAPGIVASSRVPALQAPSRPMVPGRPDTARRSQAATRVPAREWCFRIWDYLNGMKRDV